MRESRYDKVWREWRSMADNASSPQARRLVSRRSSGLPVGMLATAAVVIAVVALASQRWWPVTTGSVSPSDSGPLATENSFSVSTGSMAQASSSSSPAPSLSFGASPSTQPSPQVTSILSGTPQSGDSAMATSVATKYQTFIEQADYSKAWAMIAPGCRLAYEEFAKDWTDTASSWGPITFTLQAPSRDWIGADPNLPERVSGDYGRAFLIVVDYPFTTQTNQWSNLLVLPDVAGTTWQVCNLR
jgi:hypothetical protein